MQIETALGFSDRITRADFDEYVREAIEDDQSFCLCIEPDGSYYLYRAVEGSPKPTSTEIKEMLGGRKPYYKVSRGVAATTSLAADPGLVFPHPYFLHVFSLFSSDQGDETFNELVSTLVGDNIRGPVVFAVGTWGRKANMSKPSRRRHIEAEHLCENCGLPYSEHHADTDACPHPSGFGRYEIPLDDLEEAASELDWHWPDGDRDDLYMEGDDCYMYSSSVYVALEKGASWNHDKRFLPVQDDNYEVEIADIDQVCSHCGQRAADHRLDGTCKTGEGTRFFVADTEASTFRYPEEEGRIR